MNLKHLTDKILLSETRDLVSQERKISAKLLHYLKEIESRRLFSDLGYGSLFDLLVKEFKYSEASASRRIQSARLLKTLPEIEMKIENGNLNLTNVALAAQLFKNEEIVSIPVQKQILKELEGKTKLQSEQILRGHMKRPPVERHLLSITRDIMLMVDKLTGILGNKSQEEVVRYALTVAITHAEKNKFAVAVNPRRNSLSSTRRVSSSVKREVYKRDRVCKKCGSSFRLEYDHIKPFALGGDSSAENIRLLCRSCNQRNRMTQFSQRR